MLIIAPVAQWLGASNSCVNPILYFFFNAKFRAYLKKAITRSLLCSSSVEYTRNHIYHQQFPASGAHGTHGNQHGGHTGHNNRKSTGGGGGTHTANVFRPGTPSTAHTTNPATQNTTQRTPVKLAGSLPLSTSCSSPPMLTSALLPLSLPAGTATPTILVVNGEKPRLLRAHSPSHPGSSPGTPCKSPNFARLSAILDESSQTLSLRKTFLFPAGSVSSLSADSDKCSLALPPLSPRVTYLRSASSPPPTHLVTHLPLPSHSHYSLARTPKNSTLSSSTSFLDRNNNHHHRIFLTRPESHSSSNVIYGPSTNNSGVSSAASGTAVMCEAGSLSHIAAHKDKYSDGTIMLALPSNSSVSDEHRAMHFSVLKQHQNEQEEEEEHGGGNDNNNNNNNECSKTTILRNVPEDDRRKMAKLTVENGGKELKSNVCDKDHHDDDDENDDDDEEDSRSEKVKKAEKRQEKLKSKVMMKKKKKRKKKTEIHRKKKKKKRKKIWTKKNKSRRKRTILIVAYSSLRLTSGQCKQRSSISHLTVN